jgi:hypothetical protein
MERAAFVTVDSMLNSLYKAEERTDYLLRRTADMPHVAEAVEELRALISKFEDLHYELGMGLPEED